MTPIRFPLHHSRKVIIIILLILASQVYVQPVLPVLNETRPLVMAYNEIYRKEVEKLPGKPLLHAILKQPSLNNNYVVHWLWSLIFVCRSALAGHHPKNSEYRRRDSGYTRRLENGRHSHRLQICVTLGAGIAVLSFFCILAYWPLISIWYRMCYT